ASVIRGGGAGCSRRHASRASATAWKNSRREEPGRGRRFTAREKEISAAGARRRRFRAANQRVAPNPATVQKAAERRAWTIQKDAPVFPIPPAAIQRGGVVRMWRTSAK